MARTRCGGLRRQAGWSYLWLLLTVALIGLGLTKAVELDATLARRDKEITLLAIGAEFRAALQSYSRVPPGAHPVRLQDMLEDTRGGVLRRHLRKIYVDPMTATMDWGLVRSGGRIVGIYSLAPGVPIKQAGFEPDDLGFSNAQHYRQWIFADPSVVPK